VAQRGAVSVEACIWIASYLLAILGLVKAAYSEQPLFWLAVWPAPVAVASTIFIFFRQGFHFQNGVLVLGRRLDWFRFRGFAFLHLQMLFRKPTQDGLAFAFYNIGKLT
jgi:hypothetical protein